MDDMVTFLQLPRQIEGDLAEYTGSVTGDQVKHLSSIIITFVSFILSNSGFIVTGDQVKHLSSNINTVLSFI